MRLFEIKKEIEDCLHSCFDQETGEEFEGGLAKLEALEGIKEEKCLNTAKYIKALEFEAKALKETEEGLKKRRLAIEKKAKSLKGYLSTFALGEKYKDNEISISWRKSASVEIFGEVPIRFKKAKFENDKTKIKEALESGELSFARIENKNNIQIR